MFGDDLPMDPVRGSPAGVRVPLIVGTNAEEGRLFTAFWDAADQRADSLQSYCRA